LAAVGRDLRRDRRLLVEISDVTVLLRAVPALGYGGRVNLRLPTGNTVDAVLVSLFALISLAVFVWWLLVLVQALRVPDNVWTGAGQSKILWVLLMVFLGVLGTILYVLIARPALARTSPLRPDTAVE
jgi:hypothetical protein